MASTNPESQVESRNTKSLKYRFEPSFTGVSHLEDTEIVDDFGNSNLLQVNHERTRIGTLRNEF